MENIVLNKENGIEMTWKMSPRVFDEVSVLHKKYNNDQIGDLVFTMEAIKLLLVDKTKAEYLDRMLDGEESVLDIYEVIDDWATKVLNLIMSIYERKKKSKQ